MQVCEFSNFDKNRRNFDQNSRNIYQTKFIRPDSFEFKPILLIFYFPNHPKLRNLHNFVLVVNRTNKGISVLVVSFGISSKFPAHSA